MTEQFVLAIDQGTSATKAVAVDGAGAIVARASVPLAETRPAPGWVEQDPEELWRSVAGAAVVCLSRLPTRGQVVAAGLSTQRESMLLWERSTGRPMGPLVSWQDRRTAAGCDRLACDGASEVVRRISGLPLDPMFSALKAAWLLDHHDSERTRSGRGELCLGTVDSWLLWRLGGGHVVETGNAARTQLMDTRRCVWSPRLLDIFRVPPDVLPEITGSARITATADALASELAGVPVTAVLGDSHAALYAHGTRTPGRIKATYGTGSSVMGLTDTVELAGNGLCLTVGWQLAEPAFALEGNIRASGATLNWLAQLLATTSAQLAELAATSRSDGVHVVPGFNGLGAPWWDAGAVGLLDGITLATGRAQLARAACESIVLQVSDVVSAVDAVAGPVEHLLADGGPAGNEFLMQLQADLCGRPVHVARTPELSALGVAHLAGTAAGLWSDGEVSALDRPYDIYDPRVSAEAREEIVAAWHHALDRARIRHSDPS